MTAPDDIDATAAEYVLGTLGASERIAVDARRLRELLLEAAITDWEQRLSPLQASVSAVTPPAIHDWSTAAVAALVRLGANRPA